MSVVEFHVTDAERPMEPTDVEALRGVMRPLFERFCDVSDIVRQRCVTSLIVSYVMNSNDAEAAFAMVLADAADAVNRAIEQERERGGTA